MNEQLRAIASATKELQHIFRPVIYTMTDAGDRADFARLFDDDLVDFVHDEIVAQIRELGKIRNPSQKLDDATLDAFVAAHTADVDQYGVWIYYPWKRSVVHTLAEDEFFEVRTNRNLYKITEEERDMLRTKTIGVIGLSVGNAIASTIVMERICKKLILADFDALDLSNLNRIRSGVTNISIPKTVLLAREIAEIDPFIDVELFSDGLNDNNIHAFLHGEDPLDLLIEVCDNLEIKLKVRHIARKLRIPVLMDTSDRGMIDIERFDIEPERPIFHGLIDAFPLDFDALDIEPQLRTHLLMAIVNFETLSDRMKMSMQQIGKTITTWPQLASSVIMGGGATTDLARKILLNQHTQSGRYYVDTDAVFTGENV